MSARGMPSQKRRCRPKAPHHQKEPNNAKTMKCYFGASAKKVIPSSAPAGSSCPSSNSIEQMHDKREWNCYLSASARDAIPSSATADLSSPTIRIAPVPSPRRIWRSRTGGGSKGSKEVAPSSPPTYAAACASGVDLYSHTGLDAHLHTGSKGSKDVAPSSPPTYAAAQASWVGLYSHIQTVWLKVPTCKYTSKSTYACYSMCIRSWSIYTHWHWFAFTHWHWFAFTHWH